MGRVYSVATHDYIQTLIYELKLTANPCHDQQIHYTAISTSALFADSDTLDQPAVFTIHPTPRTYADALVSIVSQFGWQRLLVISDPSGDSVFSQVTKGCEYLSTIFKRGQGVGQDSVGYRCIASY